MDSYQRVRFTLEPQFYWDEDNEHLARAFLDFSPFSKYENYCCCVRTPDIGHLDYWIVFKHVSKNDLLEAIKEVYELGIPCCIEIVTPGFDDLRSEIIYKF